MLPALQPSRPKLPQENTRQSFAHQQRRTVYEPPRSQPLPSSQESSKPANIIKQPNPRSQVEAMPPFAPTQSPLVPPRNLYDSAIRHPVFFTEQLRKAPFPIPNMASHGWSPVANGYIQETRKADPNGVPKTKL